MKIIQILEWKATQNAEELSLTDQILPDHTDKSPK